MMAVRMARTASHDVNAELLDGDFSNPEVANGSFIERSHHHGCAKVAPIVQMEIRLRARLEGIRRCYIRPSPHV